MRNKWITFLAFLVCLSGCTAEPKIIEDLQLVQAIRETPCKSNGCLYDHTEKPGASHAKKCYIYS